MNNPVKANPEPHAGAFHEEYGSIRSLIYLLQGGFNPFGPQQPQQPSLPQPSQPPGQLPPSESPQNNTEQNQPQQPAIPPSLPADPNPPISPEDSDAQQPEKRSATSIIFTILGFVIVVGIIYFSYQYVAKLPPPRVVPPTPTAGSRFDISSCTAISSPGVYTLAKSIGAAQASGPCILIDSSNVALDGKGNKVIGSGPFVQVPPFSYGIEVINASNVTISNMNVSKFSYDIFLSNTKGSQVSNVLALNGTMSGIYLYDSSGDNVSANKVFGAASSQGGIGLAGGGQNRITNNLVMYNAYYGVSINSTKNTFLHNNITSNPVDLFCGSGANIRESDVFLSSSCSVNYYCNFARCSITNKPSNLSSIVLSKNIASCGSIRSPGDYMLAASLNLSTYVNTSNPLSNPTCINILSPNVRLDCNNMTIFNARYGVTSSGYNTMIMDCNFRNSTYGVYLHDSFADNVTGGGASGGTYGIYLRNETDTYISNATYLSNKYGVYINDSSAVTLTGTTTANNTYGVYYATGSTNAFLRDRLLGNSGTDMYCTPQTYNSSFNIMQNSTCGVTDCNWGSCQKHTLVTLPTQPVFGCETISVPGNYTLESAIVQNSGLNCITLKSSGISLNCAGKLIEGIGTGSAIYLSNINNVSIASCNIDGYGTGINATGARFLSIRNAVVSNASVGISIKNANFSQVINNKIAIFGRYGMILSGVNNSVITNNTASSGIDNSTGFSFSKSNKNIIRGNFAQSNPLYGFVFNGSRTNTISNNSAISNVGFDYVCEDGSSGIYSQQSGSVNNGVTKNGCLWMVEVNPVSIPTCYAISQSSEISLQSDMLYTFGATCYTVFNTNSTSGSSSTINCNGHTVIATNGGVFADVKTSSVTIENCNLYGFSRAIESSSPYTTLLNDTIVNSNYSVDLQNATYPTIRDNYFTNDTYGVYGQESSYGSIENNVFTNVNTGIELLGGSGFQLIGNLANAAKTGISLLNSQLNNVQGNRLLNSTTAGIACTMFATNLTNNYDQGGNICSSNSKCLWMSKSPSCRPS